MLTPEAIEAAARVNAYLADFAAKYGSADGFIDSVNANQSNGLYADDLARLTALAATLPFIAAQALRDAASDFAEGEWVDAFIHANDDIDAVKAVDKWLTERATELTP